MKKTEPKLETKPKSNTFNKIYFGILISIGIMTLIYFLKTYAVLAGLPFAINEIIKAWQ